MEEKVQPKSGIGGKIARISVLVIIILAIFGIIIASSIKPKVPIADQIWYEEMTIGNKDAKNYFITYTDIVCPYCVAFENAIIEHEEDFEKYLEENDVLFEVRLSDFLYLYGQFPTAHSKYSAVAAYCAKDEGRFWDYYRHAITTIWHDYFEEYGKDALTALDQNKKTYWLDLGKEIGLDSESFTSCFNEEKPLQEINQQAEQTSKIVSGLPAFKFNNYSPPGFNMSWGWDHVTMLFNEGLKQK